MVLSTRKPKKRKCCAKILFAFALCFALSTTCLADMAVIPMQYGTANDVLPMVRDLLSSEGRASADARTNSLLIIDTQESIQRIRAFLESHDRPVKQARVRVRFQETGAFKERSISGDARASGENWAVTTGGRQQDGAEVRLRESERRRRGDSEFFIYVASGSWAYIMVGEDILYNERWMDLCRRYATIWALPGVQRIETGFEVRPIFLQNLAQIEMMPRISRLDPGAESKAIRFSSATTSIAVPYNQWVSLGGTDSSSHEVMREILGRGRSGEASSLSMSVLVEPPPE